MMGLMFRGRAILRPDAPERQSKSPERMMRSHPSIRGVLEERNPRSMKSLQNVVAVLKTLDIIETDKKTDSPP